jgi:hypothetical protein
LPLFVRHRWRHHSCADIKLNVLVERLWLAFTQFAFSSRDEGSAARLQHGAPVQPLRLFCPDMNLGGCCVPLLSCCSFMKDLRSRLPSGEADGQLVQV